MNRNAKGNALELKAKKMLEAQGYMVFRQHRKPMFIHGRMIMVGADVFGCDLIAKRAGEKTKWVSVSTIENKSNKIKELDKFPFSSVYDDVEIWLYKKRKGFTIVHYLLRCDE